jgi:hypothetical protein
LAAGHRDQGENLVLEEDTYIDDIISQESQQQCMEVAEQIERILATLQRKVR